MQNELPRRGGSHTFAGLEAETLGQRAAAEKVARSANPYGAGSDLARVWDAAHCQVTGVDPSAPKQVAAAKPAEATGDKSVK